MFAYNFSIILIGILTFMSTFCGSLFSFTLFAMAFGGLLGNWLKRDFQVFIFYSFFIIDLGFNLCLRSVYLYEVIGLDWNDDSLFSVLTIGQSLSVLFGLPAAGK